MASPDAPCRKYGRLGFLSSCPATVSGVSIFTDAACHWSYSMACVVSSPRRSGCMSYLLARWMYNDWKVILIGVHQHSEGSPSLLVQKCNRSTFYLHFCTNVILDLGLSVLSCVPKSFFFDVILSFILAEYSVPNFPNIGLQPRNLFLELAVPQQ
jgi:hypothetical protein